MIKSEYVRILGMLDALKRTHVDGKLLDESAASYYKLLVMPIFKKEGIKANRNLRTFKTIRNTVQKLYEKEHDQTVAPLPTFKKEDDWGVEGVDWNWEWVYE